MHANTSNMNKYDYNHTQNQMADTKSKAIQQIKIEDIELSNKNGFESNTLKHYSRFSIAFWTKNNMNLLVPCTGRALGLSPAQPAGRAST